jgi:hypothetical protein
MLVIMHKVSMKIIGKPGHMSSPTSIETYYHRAFQYYALLKMRARSSISTYLTETVVPSSIPVYSIMTNNSNTASDEYGLGLKINMVEHIAGGKDKVKGWVRCTNSDCDLGFPVTKAKWTADALMALGS